MIKLDGEHFKPRVGDAVINPMKYLK